MPSFKLYFIVITHRVILFMSIHILMLSFENRWININNTNVLYSQYNNTPITIPATPDVGKPSTANDICVSNYSIYIYYQYIGLKIEIH